MINRVAVILKYNAPAVQWIKDADPCHDGSQITLEEANRECTVYLITDRDADDDKSLARWTKANFATLFEAELEGVVHRRESLATEANSQAVPQMV